MKTPSDRTLNRLIVGAILILVIGIPVVGVIYFMDRWVDAGPSMADRRTQDLEDAVRKTPNSVNLRLQLVGAYTAANRPDDAMTQLNTVLNVQPDSKTAHLARGDILRARGDLAGAKRDYQAVVDLMKGQEFAPEDTELQVAYYELGSIALQEQRPADAIPSLTEALRINRTDADALYLLGVAYLKTGETQKAVDAMRSAVLFVPIDWCDPYASLGDAYSKLAKPAEVAWAAAMVDFCKKKPVAAKQQLTPLIGGAAGVDALVGLAMIAESESDRTAAADYYQQALKLDPGNVAASTGLGRVAATPASPTPSAAPSSTVVGGIG